MLEQHQEKIAALDAQLSHVTAQLPGNKLRATQPFHVLPGYKVDNHFQYPDMLTIFNTPAEKLQPFRLGAHKFAMKAQFGALEAMKLGLDHERRHATLKTCIDQLDPSQKISLIEYSWRQYENNDHELFVYKITFRGKDDRELGTIQNLPDRLLNSHLFMSCFKLKRKFDDYARVDDDEIITAVKLGVRQTYSLVNVQFILSKI